MTGRDILVLIEHQDRKVEPVTHQLVSQAHTVARGSGGRVAGLLLCDREVDLLPDLECNGLAALYVVADDALGTYRPESFSRAATAAVRRLEPGLFLCGHTFRGMEVAPWLAAALDAPLLPNCLSLRAEGGELVAERLVFGQSWQTRLRLPWVGTAAASMARSGGAHAPADSSVAPELERLDIDPAELRARTTVIEETGTPEVDLSRAELVVGVGRGVGDASNLERAQELARTLGGVLGCSRPLVDLGWLPRERLVGISGQSIRPKVYLACGISGAAQHAAGIAEAETVIAINRDPDAAIFRVADFGAVADLVGLLPELAAEARRRHG